MPPGNTDSPNRNTLHPDSMKKASLVIFVILLPLLAWGYVTLAGSSTKMKELVTRSEGEITTYKNQIRDSEAEMKKA